MTELDALKLKVASILCNPWLWHEKTLEWARCEAEIYNIKHCPCKYIECNKGCCYPARCGELT